MSSLRGKVAIVTGASSGIGAAVAVDLAGYGCQLTLTGRNKTNLETTRNQCVQAGLDQRSILLVVADLTKDEDIERIVTETVKKFDQIDVLINNAGMSTIPDKVETKTLEQYDHVMQVNLRSPVYLTKLALPHLEKTKGTVVNVSSSLAIKVLPALPFYCMAKGAIDQFTRCCAIDLASKGIRVNSICPGITESKFFENMGLSSDVAGKFLEHMRSYHALGRNAQADEMSGMVTFLASDMSGQMTGAIVPVDGGRMNMCPNFTQE